MDNTPYIPYTPPYKYIYIYWNCFFSYSFIYYDRHLMPNGWRYFFVEIARKFDTDENLTNHKI